MSCRRSDDKRHAVTGAIAVMVMAGMLVAFGAVPSLGHSGGPLAKKQGGIGLLGPLAGPLSRHPRSPGTIGAIKEFTIATPDAAPALITPGPDGNLWFTEFDSLSSKIGRITTSGVITEFAVPTAGSNPYGIAG